MKTLYAPLTLQSRLAGLSSTFLLLLVLAAGASAQSTDLGYPTPVRSGEISGTIAPRDVGDSRLTRYYYLFTGTPGDLIVTAESENLEGDVDVFTAGVLRPLAKMSLYAGISRSGGSKTIYLRTRQALILRVEARTPNDNAGNFRIRFEGAFEAVGSEVPDPEPVIPTLSSDNKGRRVTATGARIEEPESEPEPTATIQPDANAPSAAAPTETPGETPATTTAEAAETPRPRTGRNRRPRNTRTRPAPTIRRPETPAETSASAPAVEPASGPRLIIETKDGMRIERYMSNVRRVTVERGLIVVINKDGKIERQALINVLRMAIEP